MLLLQTRIIIVIVILITIIIFIAKCWAGAHLAWGTIPTPIPKPRSLKSDSSVSIIAVTSPGFSSCLSTYPMSEVLTKMALIFASALLKFRQVSPWLYRSLTSLLLEHIFRKTGIVNSFSVSWDVNFLQTSCQFYSPRMSFLNTRETFFCLIF